MDVGIDIGSQMHEVAVRSGDRVQSFGVANTAQGNQQLIKRLQGKPCRVVMEATGVHYLDTALALVDAGIEVMVINPQHARHFGKALGWHSSTDRISAAMLAEYAHRMPFKTWAPPPRVWLEFRAIARQINRLSHQRVAAKNRLHAQEATRQGSLAVLEDERFGIELLEQRIERLNSAALELVAADAELGRIIDQFTAAVGIAQTSAIALAG